MEVGIDSSDIERQIRKLEQYPKILSKELQIGMKEATVEMQEKWQRNAPVKSRKYVMGIQRKVENKIGGEVVGIVATNVTSNKGFPYPAALENDPKYHYRSTRRRGQPTMGHLKRAIKNAQKGINKAFKRTVDRVLRKLVVR